MENNEKNRQEMTPAQLLRFLKAEKDGNSRNTGIAEEYAAHFADRQTTASAEIEYTQTDDSASSAASSSRKTYHFTEKRDALFDDGGETKTFDSVSAGGKPVFFDPPVDEPLPGEKPAPARRGKKYTYTFERKQPAPRTEPGTALPETALPDADVDIDALMKQYLSEEEYAKYSDSLSKDEEKSSGLSFEPKIRPVPSEGNAENAGSGSVGSDDIQKSIREAENFITAQEHTGDVALSADPSEKEKENADPGQFDDTDVWITSIFDGEEEAEKQFGTQKMSAVQRAAEQIDPDEKNYTVPVAKIASEYHSPAQAKSVFTAYRGEHKSLLVRLLVCFGFLLVTFFYENIGIFGGATLPGVLNPNVYPVVYIMIDLQLLVLCAVLIRRSLLNGLRAIFRLKLIPESMTVLVLAVTLIYHIALCFVGYHTDLRLFNFPVMICIFLTLVFEFLNLKREIFSFNVVSSKKPKYAVVDLNPDEVSLETEAFAEYLPHNPSMFRINRVKFVESFRRRMNKGSHFLVVLKAILPLSLLIGIVYGIVAGAVTADAFTGLSGGYLAFLLCLPFSVLFTFSYPFFKASEEAFEVDSAIIGEEALEEYSNASVISFEDKDVFPSYGVKVKSVKVYGDNRIDQVLYCAASLFRKVGGPLADVFDMATLELGHSENVELIEADDDGLEMIVDNDHVFVGRASYLRKNKFEPILDPDDETVGNAEEVSIMYIVSNNQIIAKMYIQYMIDPDFEFTLKQLYKAGMCVGIKTFDPNITDRLLNAKFPASKYPVKLLRCRDLDDVNHTIPKADSGIVSKNSPRCLLQTLAMCGKVLHIEKTSIVLKGISMLLSVLLMVFLLVFRQVGAMSGIYVTLYQLFWILPMYILAKIYI